MRNFKRVKTQTHFGTSGEDWAKDLLAFRRTELALRQGDPSGSTRGAQMQAAAARAGSRMAIKTSGMDGSGARSTRKNPAVDASQSNISEWLSPAPSAAPSTRSGPARNTRHSQGGGTSASDVNGRPAHERHQTVLIYPDESSKDAVTLTNEDMDRLTTQEFLNDSLVDYELKRIQERLEKDDPAMLARCHFFNSFFYKRLLESVGKRVNDPPKVREGFKRVERWTKNTDLFSKDFIFVPINEALHWSLAIICKPGAYLPAELRQTVSTALVVHGGAAAAEDAADGDDEADEAAEVGAEGEAERRDSVSPPPPPPPPPQPPPGEAKSLSYEDDDIDESQEEELAETKNEWAPEIGNTGEDESGTECNDEDDAPLQELDGDAAEEVVTIDADEEAPPKRQRLSRNKPDEGGAAGAGADAAPTVSGEVQPCILYLDSLGGRKPRAMKLLQAYMHEEWWAKKRKRDAAAAGAAAGATDASASTAAPSGPPALPAPPPTAAAAIDGARPAKRLRGGSAGSSAGAAVPDEAVGLSQASQASSSSVEEVAATSRPSPESPTMGGGVDLREASGDGDGIVPSNERLFAELPTHDVKVSEQHNHCDCALYMLRYIELVSKFAPPLWFSPYKWIAHEEGTPEMKIDPSHIDKKRKLMHEEIRKKGATQKAQKDEEKQLQIALERSKTDK